MSGSPWRLCRLRLARRPQLLPALTPVVASTEVAFTAEGARRKVALKLRLQARLSCVCACTPLSVYLRFPIITLDKQRPRSLHGGARSAGRVPDRGLRSAKERKGEGQD